MEMTSRERVKAAIAHQEPDKVPVDLGGMQTSIHVRAYDRLIDYLGISDDTPQYMDVVQHIALPCEALLKRFEVDTRYIRPEGAIKPRNFVPEVEGEFQGVYDQFGIFWGDKAEKSSDDILYLDPVIHPLADIQTVKEIENYSWPDGTDWRLFHGMREEAQHLRETTDFALGTNPAGCIFEMTTFLFGFTKAYRYLRIRPELITTAMQCLLNYWLDYATTLLGEIGEYLDVYFINGDLAEQAGPLMNVKLYEEYIKPYERQLADRVHDLTSAAINYHCCGSTPQFLPHFAEIGYNIYNPVQISAADMEPCSLKQRFGDSITFWGGACNTQATLPFGTPDTIRS
ncbi:MAG TPA: uroporphyrinogen decarboxylase family protein, partial [Candidatus Lokiarchaeia archaeon]|nr:uroporphyrinogen decarboxylase family protein [Candidatus Lokiarchaeia archaeon]